MRDWSKLPNDLIGRITSSLPLQHYFRFSAVCRSWFLAAKEKYHPPASQVPWLLLSDSAETKTCNLYNMYEEKLYNAELPDIYGRLRCGSSHGWLVTIDDELVVRLSNPFSKACIQLPCLPSWSIRWDKGNLGPTHWHTDWSGEASQYSDDDDNSSEDSDTGDYVLSEVSDSDESNFEGGGDYDGGNCNTILPEPRMRDMCINKAVVSADPTYSEDYVVMALLRDMGRLALWRPGNLCWLDITKSEEVNVDVIWRNGKFYAITVRHSIVIVDACSDPKVKVIILDLPEGWYNRVYSERLYLVDLLGKLLLVRRLSGEEPDFEESSQTYTKRFEVFKIDLVKRRVYPLRDLGEYAIFVGTNHSIAISAREFIGCRKNCIYFTGDVTDWPSIIGDVGIYDLTQRRVEPFLPLNGVFSQTTSFSTWINPNPW